MAPNDRKFAVAAAIIYRVCTTGANDADPGQSATHIPCGDPCYHVSRCVLMIVVPFCTDCIQIISATQAIGRILSLAGANDHPSKVWPSQHVLHVKRTRRRDTEFNILECFGNAGSRPHIEIIEIGIDPYGESIHRRPRLAGGSRPTWSVK